MTIFATLLSRGYFPKELPPGFSTEDFAWYATTKAGRAALATYKPADNFTELLSYRLALPGQGGLTTRPLALPHPWAFAALSQVVAKNFRRLLKKAGTSKFSKSRPVYALGQPRAIRTLVKPANLARERSNARGGATHLLKVDISQFYPSLYSHAVGWAIDPKLRQKKHWNNTALLGKKIDQLLMNMQGKVSQGVPIGNDISFLLAELVLSQVDKAVKVRPKRAFRWFDDYEIACSSRQQAEEVLARLNGLLGSFRLRPNPSKTRILELPYAAGDGWQGELRTLSQTAFRSAAQMVSYFDHAFGLRVVHTEQPVLMYAIGVLFKVRPPSPEVRSVAESCITQALLSEPGCAQKAFALLTFWELNGAPFDRALIAETVDQLIQLHEYRGVSSDVAWGLAFCIQHGVKLSRRSGRSLSRLQDDAIAVEALHAASVGIVPGFNSRDIARDLKTASCDGEHWLLLYEAVRHGFIPSLKSVVAAHALFNDMLVKNVSFYRLRLPPYAALLHPGGAPEWVVLEWIRAATGKPKTEALAEQRVARMIGDDVAVLDTRGKAFDDLIRELLDRLTGPRIGQLEPYA